MPDEKPPYPLDTFNHKDRTELDAMLRWATNASKLEIECRKVGRIISSRTINHWRKVFNIPIYDEIYRFREMKSAGKWEEAQTADLPEFDPVGDLAKQMRKHLRRRGEKTVEELADFFSVPPKEIRAAVTMLEEDAALVKVQGDSVHLDDAIYPSYEPEIIDFRKYREVEIPLGITGDNHLGSKYERLDVLETLFDRYEVAGVQTVYQMGNIIDGERRGINENDIYTRGFENQCANLIEKWPRREGITTQFITGNCHEGWYIKRENINVGKRIEQDALDAGREDLVFLGHLEHDLEFQQDGGSGRIRMLHASGGSAYATSWREQKIVESYQGGEKPNGLLIGHFHKYNTGYPREVHTCQVGCTQDQSPWMRAHNIAAHVGGVILWLTQNEKGIFTRWRTEWIPFYDRKFYAFNW